MKRKFVKNQDLKTEFYGFMDEYENLQHMQITQDNAKYYMPHHASNLHVLKQNYEWYLMPRVKVQIRCR